MSVHMISKLNHLHICWIRLEETVWMNVQNEGREVEKETLRNMWDEEMRVHTTL